MRARLFASTLLATCALAAPALAQSPATAAAMAPASTAAATPDPVPQGKLPDAVIPSAYRVDLTLDPAQKGFSGHVEIDAMVKTATRFVYIHGRELKVAKVTAAVNGHAIMGQWQDADPSGVALLTFAEPLPAGQATFAFDYTGIYHDGPAGLFHVKVGDTWYGWSQFESTDARSAYPGFDQPGYKQPFTVTLRTPVGQKAVSNAPETSVTQENGMDVHHFAPTLPLPTYLLALFTGPFATADSTIPADAFRDHPLPLRIVTTQPNAAMTAFALANTKPIIAHLEAYFGQSFPYAKLDQVTAPIMPGAMENAGADLYEDGLLIMGDGAPTRQKRGFGMVVSHELSHQWFGDLVTPAWWDDIWLNESFANWMGYRIGNEWRPDLHIASGALAEGFAAMGTDALIAGRPIHQAITRTAQIDAAFDTITYGKGGQVVAMIAAFMGDEKFRDGVRHYMATHRYGNGTSAEFFGAMADVAGDARILPAMQSFTDQQGVPLLTFTGVEPRYAGGTSPQYTVTQSRYVRFGTAAPDITWGVPMCLRRGATRSCSLLVAKTMPVNITGDGPMMPNAGGTGYYRFELPAAEWDALIAASATLPSGEALALADSLRASFLAGRAHASKLGELAQTMVNNPDSYASDAALNGLITLSDSGFFDAKATAAYHALVGRLYRPMLAQMGFDPRVGAYAAEEAEHAQRRVQLIGKLSGIAKDPALRTQLANAADAFVKGDAKALDPSFYGSGFGALVERGGLPMAKTLSAVGLASQNTVLRGAAFAAVASSGKPDIAAWVLNTAPDPRLRISERLTMVAILTQTDGTRDIGYNWMRDNADMLLKGGAGIFFASRLPQVFGGFCSVEKADAIARDFAPKLAGKTGQLELDRTLERVRDCGLLKTARAKQASAEVAGLR